MPAWVDLQNDFQFLIGRVFGPWTNGFRLAADETHCCRLTHRIRGATKGFFMNFDDAIKVHTDWKLKLSKYIKHPDHTLKSTEISVDSRCELGKWIHGEGQKFASLPEYSKLKNEHSRFHHAAAAVVAKADAGADESQDVALGSKSEYSVASSGVVSAIMAMKAKAGK
jgi:hypothetical protein